MVYRKAVYQVVNGDMEEKIAESFDEFCAYCKDGWHDHPETARNAVVEVARHAVQVIMEKPTDWRITEPAAWATACILDDAVKQYDKLQGGK